VATYGAESSMLNKDNAKRLAGFRRKVSRRMFGGIEVHENWGRRYDEELLQLFGDLDILSFVRISRLNWIDHVNRMYNKIKASKNKGKAVPLYAWSSPKGSRTLRFPDYKTTEQDGGKVVTLTHRLPLPPGNAPGTHFC